MYVPRMGDTLIVHDQSKFSNGTAEFPAIIQQTFNENDPHNQTRCNVIAFPPFMTPQQLGSVPFYPSRPAQMPEGNACWPKLEGHHHVGDDEPTI